jgi:hypothetical protein
MALTYIPTVWHNYDLPVLDAANLNKMENAMKAAYDALSICVTVQTGTTSGTPGTGWYRIATNGSCILDATDGTRAVGEFIVYDTTTSGQAVLAF